MTTLQNLRVNPNAPSTANELELFAKDDKLHTIDSTGTVTVLDAPIPPIPPAGSRGDIQMNNGEGWL